MSASNKLIQAAAGVGGAEDTDPDFANAVLLLNGDDAPNGGQNNTFLDSSSNTHSITRNGNVTQGSFSPFSVDDGKWGVYFDGSSEIQTDSTINIGTSNFTVEFWVNWDGQDTNASFVATNGTSGSSWVVRLASSDLVFRKASTTDITTTHTMEVGVWTHVAVVREGTGTNQVKIYVNGVNVGEGTATNDYGTRKINIGAGRGSAPNDVGHLSNVRLVVGSAVYTAGFTPSTTPLTDITNTKLLTCQSNRLVDNSSIGDTFTLTGPPKVTPFSPFPQTTAYDASTNGGSGYFTGDYLNTSATSGLAFNSTDYTAEAWVYYPSANYSAFDSGGRAIFSDFNSGPSDGRWSVRLSGSQKMAFQEQDSNGANTVTVSDPDDFPLQQWVHVMAVKSGTTMYLFINGNLVDSGTSASRTEFTGKINIGAFDASSASFKGLFFGYISNVRLLKGTALHTSSFTPPTAPLTDITNTKLLCNFTNASIKDATGRNVLETVGNAQVDTTTFKYGTGAMEFDGTGDYLLLSSSEQLTFGTGDFTIEFWLNTADATVNQTLLDMRPASTNGAYPLIYIPSGGGATVNYLVGGSNRITSGTISSNTWIHVALSRSGTDTKLFIDGTQGGSTYTDSTDYLSSRMVIGAGSLNLGNAGLNGYIDDLRITKGIARYTTTFTPPTKALPVIGE